MAHPTVRLSPMGAGILASITTVLHGGSTQAITLYLSKVAFIHHCPTVPTGVGGKLGRSHKVNGHKISL